jgi:hypothetical protein
LRLLLLLLQRRRRHRAIGREGRLRRSQLQRGLLSKRLQRSMHMWGGMRSRQSDTKHFGSSVQLQERGRRS